MRPRAPLSWHVPLPLNFSRYPLSSSLSFTSDDCLPLALALKSLPHPPHKSAILLERKRIVMKAHTQGDTKRREGGGTGAGAGRGAVTIVEPAGSFSSGCGVW